MIEPVVSDSAPDDREQALFQSFVNLGIIEKSVQFFRETENAMFAWQALKKCAEFGIQVHPEILSYLVSVADDLQVVALDPQRISKQTPQSVMGALKISTNGMSEFKNFGNRQHFCGAVAMLIVRDGGQFKAAVSKVSERFAVSASTVMSALVDFFPSREDEEWETYFKAVRDSSSVRYSLDVATLVQKSAEEFGAEFL
jgi:hypothetical protein